MSARTTRLLYLYEERFRDPLQEDRMTPLVIIGGATGTGKSEIAVALAKKLNGEIISCDSMQIYRGLDIGTAKIKNEETKGIPHHMIDVCDPSEGFTAADYKGRATKIIQDVYLRGKVPIFCGGTGLYINAVLYDLSFSGEYDKELRAFLLEELQENGKEYMHQKLASLDPSTASKLHVNDEKRVVRAIEKALTGGREENDFTEAKYPHLICVTEMPREALYDKINARVDNMLKAGLKEEVWRLLSKGIDFDKQCMQAIAYKEWAHLLKGEMTENEVVELIKKNTRNYAKRQITWFKQYKDALKLSVPAPAADLASQIAERYGEMI